jgi:hypothetical protein
VRCQNLGRDQRASAYFINLGRDRERKGKRGIMVSFGVEHRRSNHPE